MAQHTSQQGTRRTYRPLPPFVLPLVALALLLAGCGEGFCNCPAMQFPTVNVAHVRPIHGLDDTLLDTAESDFLNRSGAILGLATYRAGDGSDALLVLLGDTIYALALPDGRAKEMAGMTCGGATLSVTADGSHIACISAPEPRISRVYGCSYYCLSQQLLVANYHPGNEPPIGMPQTISDGANFISSPTWRPDGGALAVVEFGNLTAPYDSNNKGPLCSLVIFAPTSLGDSPLAPALRLSTDDFSLCDSQQIAWSPDGRTLAILTTHALLLAPAPAPNAISNAASAGHAATGALRGATRIALTNQARRIAWAPDSNAISVVISVPGNDLDQVIQHPLDASTSPTVLLSLPTSYPDDRANPSLGSLVYSTDGRMLLFAFGSREFGLFPQSTPPPSVGDAYQPDGRAARIPQTALRPQICECPNPPTGLFAYTVAAT